MLRFNASLGLVKTLLALDDFLSFRKSFASSTLLRLMGGLPVDLEEGLIRLLALSGLTSSNRFLLLLRGLVRILADFCVRLLVRKGRPIAPALLGGLVNISLADFLPANFGVSKTLILSSMTVEVLLIIVGVAGGGDAKSSVPTIEENDASKSGNASLTPSKSWIRASRVWQGCRVGVDITGDGDLGKCPLLPALGDFGRPQTLLLFIGIFVGEVGMFLSSDATDAGCLGRPAELLLGSFEGDLVEVSPSVDVLLESLKASSTKCPGSFSIFSCTEPLGVAGHGESYGNPILTSLRLTLCCFPRLLCAFCCDGVPGIVNRSQPLGGAIVLSR